MVVLLKEGVFELIVDILVFNKLCCYLVLVYNIWDF